MQRLLVKLLLPLLTLGSCASVNYTPVSVDSQMPEIFRQHSVDNRLCPAALAENRSCVALVRAENWYSDTGVRTEPGQSYCFHVPPGQAWFDAGRRNTPPRGEYGSALMNVLRDAKRHNAPWFTLMAGVSLTPVPTTTPASPAEFPSKQFLTSLTAFDPYNVASRRHVKTGDRDEPDPEALVTTKPGALVMYPNDAWGPALRPGYFYENNSGQIWVQVTRVRKGEICTGMLAL